MIAYMRAIDSIDLRNGSGYNPVGKRLFDFAEPREKHMISYEFIEHAFFAALLVLNEGERISVCTYPEDTVVATVFVEKISAYLVVTIEEGNGGHGGFLIRQKFTNTTEARRWIAAQLHPFLYPNKG